MILSVDTINKTGLGKYRVTADGKVSQSINIQQRSNKRIVWYEKEVYTPEAYMEIYGSLMGANAQLNKK